MPILMSISSGHGTGKSVLGAWIANWIMSTRPHSIGTVTANTFKQLETRTWAAIRYWTKLCITAHWFEIRKTGIYSKESPEDWKVVMQTCREENAQSFAGQHAKNSTSWYLFDEASNIPDAIWDVAFGGLTDGEPMFFAWGQPSRSNGKFHEITFGSLRNRWNHRTIDSRKSRFTNKELIEQWRVDYGEDSDLLPGPRARHSPTRFGAPVHRLRPDLRSAEPRGVPLRRRTFGGGSRCSARRQGQQRVPVSSRIGRPLHPAHSHLGGGSPETRWCS